LHELGIAVNALLAELNSWHPSKRKVTALAVATFASYEAKRNVNTDQGRFITGFYKVFLGLTLLSPIFVAAAAPGKRDVVWDAFGIGSTLLLLYITYGIYTFHQSMRAWNVVREMFGTLPFDWAQTSDPEEEQKTGGDTEAWFALGLLSLGSVLSVFAIWQLVHLYQMSAPGHDASLYAQTYLCYFGAVFTLSITFVFMDIAVAAFNESHSDTYIAASSAAHATIPMCFGIGLVGIYLGAELTAAWWSGAEHPWESLSVEFASGALTFQMIISNVLFILIKKNYVFRFFYNSIHSTRRD
jgi:hypothetical protein